MERRLKGVILDYLLETLVQIFLAVFISGLSLKLLMEIEVSRDFIVSNLKSESDIMLGLGILYLIYFVYSFYKKIEASIFKEVDKLLNSIKKDTYEGTYETYEFNEISQAFEKKRQEIIEKDKELVRGISYISHDIKTPITVINTNVSLIKDSKELISGINLVRMDRIQAESEKISEYIDKIMNITKSQLEENEVEKIKLSDLLASIDKNITLYSDVLEEEIEVSREIKALNSYVYANISSINECLTQLLNNAYKYKKEKIKIKIKATNQLGISVIDDGSGFEEEMLNNSRNLFETSNIARTTGKGHGIGLYYVDNYLEKISGKLELSNTEIGTVARMVIPLEVQHG